jgi:hypothetical protein
MRTRTFTRASLVGGGPIASAVLIGGTAVAVTSTVDTPKVAASSWCHAYANHGQAVPIYWGTGTGKVGTIGKGKQISSACSTVSYYGYAACGKTSYNWVHLTGSPEGYVEATCVSNLISA